VAGRPSKYSPERSETILGALRNGNTRRTAAALAGVDVTSLARWLTRYADFAAAIQKAEADAEASHVANIQAEATDGTWTASAWWLERRRHKDWGRVDRVEIMVRQQAERLAEELGVDVADVLREAERIVAGGA